MVNGSASPMNRRTPSLMETPAGTVTAWGSAFLSQELIDQMSTTLLLSACRRDCKSEQRLGVLSSCWTQTTSQLPNDFSVRVAARAGAAESTASPAPTRIVNRRHAARRDGATLMPGDSVGEQMPVTQ